MHPQREHRLVPVLFIGQDSALAAKLWEHGIGVITTDSVDRALRLLTNFTVAAVICDAPAVESILDFAATGTRVIGLVDEEHESTRRDVTMLLRPAPVASIAAAVRQCVEPACRAGEGGNASLGPESQARPRDVHQA